MSSVYKIFGLGHKFPFGTGISNLDMLITFTDFDRLLVEPVYKNEDLKKNSNIKGFIPFSPNNESQILHDALLLFAPSIFKHMNTYPKLLKYTKENKVIAFSKKNPEWEEIRKESEKIFKQLNIFELKIISK